MRVISTEIGLIMPPWREKARSHAYRNSFVPMASAGSDAAASEGYVEPGARGRPRSGLIGQADRSVSFQADIGAREVVERNRARGVPKS